MFLYRFEYRDAMAYDLTDLELFLQVVDQGSITQGAERAHLSLASASARITAMEKALGAKLLDRCSDGLQPTLVVLANTSATQTLVPTALADFLATHSDVDVELQERPSHEIVAAVTTGVPSSESSPTQWTRLGWPGAELDDRTQRRTPNC